MAKFVMDTLVPKSFTIEAPDLATAGQMAKGLLVKRETLMSVKPLELWEEHELLIARGERPDVNVKK